MGDFRQRVGLVHELRQLRGAEEFTHRSHNRFRVDQVMRHDRIDIDRTHTLLDRALHAHEADAVIVFHQLADRTDTTVAEVINVVDFALAVLQVEDDLHDTQNVVMAQHAHVVRSGLIAGHAHIQAHVHFHAANSREIITLRIEEELAEQGVSGVLGWRLTWAHHAIDVRQGFKTGFVLVGLQRIAQPRATAGRINVEHFDRADAVIAHFRDDFFFQHVASFAEDLTGFGVHNITRQELADQSVGRHEDLVCIGFRDPLGLQGGDLLASFGNGFAGLGINKVVFGLHTLPRIGAETGDPASLVHAIDGVGVEQVEDLLGVIAERIEHRRRRQLALAVDTDVQHVLGIELEVEPRTTVRNDAGCEQQLAGGVGLALVMIEEHARRAVHLRDDHTLGAVHHKRTLVSHQRDVAEIAFLLFDFLDRAGARVFVDIEHDELEANLQRRLIGQVALDALFHVEFRRFKFIRDIFQRRALGKVGDREHRLEHATQAIIRPLVGGGVHLEEVFVAFALNLDQVWHFDGFGNAPEGFADTFLFREGECHPRIPFFVSSATGLTTISPEREFAAASK